jgi:hypothetical protein
MSASSVRQRLQRELASLRERHPSYSLRAFAKRLAISPTALSAIIAGKRPVTLETARRVIAGLELSAAEAGELLREFHLRIEKGGAGDAGQGDGKPSYRLLAMDSYRLISDWFHAAIISLSETVGFRRDPRWIGRRLGIPPLVASRALDRLVRLGILAPEHGEPAGPIHTTTTDDVPNRAVRSGHRQNLDLARAALDRLGVEQRDFTALTLAVDPSTLPAAKLLIRRFLDDMACLMEVAPKTEVYKLCVQLFPLSTTATAAASEPMTRSPWTTCVPEAHGAVPPPPACCCSRPCRRRPPSGSATAPITTRSATTRRGSSISRRFATASAPTRASASAPRLSPPRSRRRARPGRRTSSA